MKLTITHRLEIMLNGDLPLLGQGLDLCLSVRLPVVDVLVVPDTERSACENDRADVVVKARCADGFLVSLGGTGLLGQDESGSDPDGGGAQHKCSGEALAVVDTAGGDDLDGLAGHG